MESEEAPEFPLFPEVISGDTADVYFLRARQILAETNRNPQVGMEIFSRRGGVCCGILEVKQLLTRSGFEGELWAVHEGHVLEPGQPALEIFGRYQSFGVYETAILGILASCTSWASAAREVVDAAGGVPVTSFGARHVHPNVSAIMDYAAIVGGCVSCSTQFGARLAHREAAGTMPHAYVLINGDTVRAAEEFNRAMPANVPRIILVDTFQDEAVESVRVAQVLKSDLDGVRLDTPSERGGVTPELVTEVRARLDLAGFPQVQIHVSGGLTPERIRLFCERGAPVDGYGVGSYISGAKIIDYTGDIREIEGTPISKRGRIPGMSRDSRLTRVL